MLVLREPGALLDHLLNVRYEREHFREGERTERALPYPYLLIEGVRHLPPCGTHHLFFLSPDDTLFRQLRARFCSLCNRYDGELLRPGKRTYLRSNHILLTAKATLQLTPCANFMCPEEDWFPDDLPLLSNAWEWKRIADLPFDVGVPQGHLWQFNAVLFDPHNLITTATNARLPRTFDPEHLRLRFRHPLTEVTVTDLRYAHERSGNTSKFRKSGIPFSRISGTAHLVDLACRAQLFLLNTKATHRFSAHPHQYPPVDTITGGCPVADCFDCANLLIYMAFQGEDQRWRCLSCAQGTGSAALAFVPPSLEDPAWKDIAVNPRDGHSLEYLLDAVGPPVSSTPSPYHPPHSFYTCYFYVRRREAAHFPPDTDPSLLPLWCFCEVFTPSIMLSLLHRDVIFIPAAFF